MSKIVNINEFKKKRNKQDLPLSNEGCFITMNGVRFEMGGAFVQDMVTFIQDHRSELVDLMKEVSDIQVSVINNTILNDEDTNATEQEKESIVRLLIEGTIALNNDLIKMITEIDSIRDFFDIFEEDSEQKVLATTFVVMLVGLRFDSLSLHRLIKNQWIDIQPNVDAFTNLEVYKSYSLIRDEINNEQN